MAQIKYEDEFDLQRKVVKILNKQGFHFAKAGSGFFCDLVDEVNKIYIEVKLEDLAPTQILYGLAKNNISEASFIGLACAYEVRFYELPAFPRILAFAKSIDPTLQGAPSTIGTASFDEQAFELLGSHCHIYTYTGPLSLDKKEKEIFLNRDNYAYFQSIFKKYQINPAQFITFIADIYARNSHIIVNEDGKIFETRKLIPYRNTDNQQRTLSDIDYLPIKNYRDRTLLEWTRIRAEDVKEILHQIDRLEPQPQRRVRGRFFTKDLVSTGVADIVKNAIDPTFIIEPYVGGGSLIDILAKDVPGVANDINAGFIKVLTKKFEGFKWEFTSLNTITTKITDLLQNWNVPLDTPRLLILTNPPFGTSSTNVLASQKGEFKEDKKSRTIKIDYGGLGDTYGRGDLCIPAIAKLIEIVKHLGHGYIATFSPAGVMCGRNRYNKLLKALLKDFEFMEGYIFSGELFNGVASKKAIAFTVWHYHRGVNTDIESLVFNCDDKEVKVKRCLLLKDGWKYDTREYLNGEIAVQGNDRFNVAVPKMLHLDIQKGGSELIQANVKIDLNVPNIPSPLIYGLWSTVVGYRAIAGYPIYIDNAYTHLPDFKKEEVQQILAYAVIYNLVVELKSNYTKGKIGFIGMQRQFKFGDNPDLTKGCLYLIETYGHCVIDIEKNYTIKTVFEWLKSEPDVLKIDDKVRNMIKKRIEELLGKIGYWDYLPIPKSV